MNLWRVTILAMVMCWTGSGVSRSRMSQLPAEVKENGENGKMGGKWGENGGLWEIAKNTLWEVYKKGVQLGDKRERNWRKMGQSGTKFPFLPVPFSPFFHGLGTFPSETFDEFC